MFCSNCGNKLEEGLRFCTKCGTPVAVAPQPVAPPPAAQAVVSAPSNPKPEKAPKAKKEKKAKPEKTNKKGGKIFLGIVASLLVVALLAGLGWYLLLPRDDAVTPGKDTPAAPAWKLELDVSTHSLPLNSVDNLVCFYAVSQKEVKEVKLYDGDNQLVATMLDDGLGYDEEAGDLIYTAALEIDTQAEGSTQYTARADKKASDTEIVSIIAPLTEEELISMSVVDETIRSFHETYSYSEEEYDVKKEAALEMLAFLSDNGHIDADSIYVDDENQSISFYYTCGVIGMITLEDYIEGEEYEGGGMTLPSAVTSAQAFNSGTVIEKNETEVIDAKILYAWFENSWVDSYKYDRYSGELREIVNLCNAYGFNTVYDEEVTVDDLKNLSEDEFVSIQAHGVYTTFKYENGEKYWFFFNEKETVKTSGFGLLQKATRDTDAAYSMDLKSGRLIKKDSEYIVLPAFFDEHYSRKDLQNTIMFFGSCQIMGKNGEYCEDWSKVLTSKSVKAFIAFHNSVLITYGHEICDTLIRTLFDGSTISQALEYAMEQNGETDEAWCQKTYGKTKQQAMNTKKATVAAFPVLRGDPDARLVSVIGSIRGKVADAVDKTPLTGATLEVRKTGESSALFSIENDADGNFIFDLEEGVYDILVTLDGYMNCEITQITVEKGHTTYLENTILLTKVEGNPVAKVSGMVTNAVTDQRVQGAVIRFRENWGNRDGEYVTSGNTVITVTTDEYGNYYTDQLPYGYYTLEVTCEAFATQYINVIATNDERTYQNQNVVLAPEAYGNDFRITLEWESDPRDEDAHIVGTLPYDFHVFYGDKSAYYADELIANLDHDDTDGNGFETITLRVDPAGTYYYYVHHYAGYGSLSTSNAVVKVYQGGVMIKQFNVPVDQGTGIYWNVFNIVDGKVITINRISDSPSQ